MKLSLVTAVKDGFTDFAATIPTVLGQTIRDFEWIVIDDGSAQPIRIAFPALAADSRVRILREEKSQGQTLSLNEGIRAAKGEWIVRIDGDDLCHPERLERTLGILANQPEAALLFSDYLVIDEENRTWAEVKMKHPLSDAFFHYLERRNNPICHPTTAFRRLKPDGSLRLFRADLVNAQDYALWREIFRDLGRGSFVHLPFPAISYRIARGSLSGARALEQRDELQAIREGQLLDGRQRGRASLGEAQKSAMQAYRLLYYRFVGHSAPAAIGEELALLKACKPMPGQFARAVFFLMFRPARSLFLRAFFGGIYD